MSASHHLPQRHLNLLPSSVPQNSSFSVRPSISERFSQLIHEIEVFLLACTYEEMCKFWNAIANLRHCLQNCAYPSEVPQFLTGRRRHREFCRILEVLADLTYPQMHLSNHLAVGKGSKQTQTYPHSQQSDLGYPHLVTQR